MRRFHCRSVSSLALSAITMTAALATAACGDSSSTSADAGDAGATPDAPIVSECPAEAATGTGTMHASVSGADETWTLAGSPHRVPSSMTVYNATITIEPCVTVLLGEGAVMQFGDSVSPGNLVALGTATRPITFMPNEDAEYGGGLAFAQLASGDLANVVIDRGANLENSNHQGAIVLRGDDNPTAALPILRVSHVAITNSAGFGLYAVAAGGFTADSTALTITGSGQETPLASNVDTRQPVYAEALSISTLPEGGSYTGNGSDSIQWHIRGTVAGNLHFKALGVPYRMDAAAVIRSEVGSITWTIDAGVTIGLSGGGAIKLNEAFDSDGVRVVAMGTAAKPITFTSLAATPVAGDWQVFDWEAAPAADPGSLRHVIFEYGGGDNGHNGFGCGPGNSAGLLIIHEWTPPSDLIADCTFRHSASGAIVSGWVAPDQLPNFASGNTFEDNASSCQVSMPSAGAFCASDENPQCYL